MRLGEGLVIRDIRGKKILGEVVKRNTGDPKRPWTMRIVVEGTEVADPAIGFKDYESALHTIHVWLQTYDDTWHWPWEDSFWQLEYEIEGRELIIEKGTGMISLALIDVELGICSYQRYGHDLKELLDEFWWDAYLIKFTRIETITVSIL